MHIVTLEQTEGMEREPASDTRTPWGLVVTLIAITAAPWVASAYALQVCTQ